MFAGLTAFPDVITEAAAFCERSTFIAVSRLSDDDSRVALVRPATSSGVVWDASALDQVIRDAGGYPYLVHLLGATRWDAATPRVGSTLTLHLVADSTPRASESWSGSRSWMLDPRSRRRADRRPPPGRLRGSPRLAA